MHLCERRKSDVKKSQCSVQEYLELENNLKYYFTKDAIGRFFRPTFFIIVTRLFVVEKLVAYGWKGILIEFLKV